MKKAILVVSFGTSYLDTLEKTIENAENQIRNSFSEYDIYRAFTSHKIIKKLKEKYEIFVDKPEEMMEKLYEDGYEEVIMQPLHMIPGEEFIYVNKIAEAFKDKFSILKVGRPIFYYQGIEELPQDYSLFIEATKELYEKNNAVVYVELHIHQILYMDVYKLCWKMKDMKMYLLGQLRDILILKQYLED